MRDARAPPAFRDQYAASTRVSPVACGSRGGRKGATTRTEEPTGVGARTERGCNKNRKGLEHEPKGDVSPVACGSHRVPKGATARIERGCKKNRKGLQQEPKGATT